MLVRAVATPLGHLAGTCAMGPATDPDAVVDATLAVHGVQGLRVAGAAVMPDVVNAPPEAAALMIGDRCAEFVLRGAPGPRLTPCARGERMAAMSAVASPVAGSLTSVERRAFTPGPFVAAAAIAVGAWLLHVSYGWRMGALFLVGTAAGVVLYHAAFGFTSAWRVFIADGRGEGLRAQMLMLALTCAVFFPLLAQGEAFGVRLNGLVQPPGLPVVIGAFIFGIGMQLGGGCASGTLFSVGGGSTRMVVTLLAFIAGSVIATAHSAFWGSLPSYPAASLVSWYGPVGRARAQPRRVRRDQRRSP